MVRRIIVRFDLHPERTSRKVSVFEEDLRRLVRMIEGLLRELQSDHCARFTVKGVAGSA